jgi:hypothetical protein
MENAEENQDPPEIADGAHRLHERYGIGYKLLHKMGFQLGRGLGAREQGIAEPIQVQPISGRKGLNEEIAQSNRIPARPVERPTDLGARRERSSTSSARRFHVEEYEDRREYFNQEDLMNWSAPEPDSGDVDSKYAAELPAIQSLIQQELQTLQSFIKDQETTVQRSRFQSYVLNIESTLELNSLQQDDQGKLIMLDYFSNFEPEDGLDAEHSRQEAASDSFAAQVLSKVERKLQLRDSHEDTTLPLTEAASRVLVLAELSRSLAPTSRFIAPGLFRALKQIGVEILHQFSDALVRSCGLGDLFCALTSIYALWECSTWVLLFPDDHVTGWEFKLDRVLQKHTETFEEWMKFVGPLTSFQSHHFLGLIYQACNMRLRRGFRDWIPANVSATLTRRDFSIGQIQHFWSEFIPLDDVIHNTFIVKLKRCSELYLKRQSLNTSTSAEIVEWSLAWRRFIGDDCFDLNIPTLKEFMTSVSQLDVVGSEAKQALLPLETNFPSEMELFLRKTMSPYLSKLLSQVLPTDSSCPERFITLASGAALFLDNPSLLFETLRSSGFFEQWITLLNDWCNYQLSDIEEIHSWYQTWKSVWQNLGLHEAPQFIPFNIHVLQILHANSIRILQSESSE